MSLYHQNDMQWQSDAPTRTALRRARAWGHAVLAGLLMLVSGAVLAQVPANPYSYSRTSAFEYDAVTGLLTRETVEPGAATGVVTTYGYDGFGNRSTATTANDSGATGSAVFVARTSGTTYDAQSVAVVQAVDGTVKTVTSPRGMFGTLLTNALNQNETRTFDPRFGAPLSLRGPNALTTSWQVDEFGRTVVEKLADGTSKATFYCFVGGRVGDTSSNSQGCPTPTAAEIPALAVSFTHAEQRNSANAKIGAFTRVYADALGRTIRTASEAFDGASQAGGAARMVVQDTDYSPQGAVLLQTQPYFLDSSSSTSSGNATSDHYGMTRTDYDALGRPVAVYTLDSKGSQVSVAFGSRGSFTAARIQVTYSAMVTVTTDDAGYARREEKNVNGKVVRVTDPLGAQLAHQYDAFDNLVKTRDALQNVITAAYDVRGRKRMMVDPDLGTVQYDFNALGLLVEQINANQAALGQRTMMSYDLLGRMIQRVEPEYTSNWYYDTYVNGGVCAKGIGKLCESTTSTGVRRKYVFDSFGRPSSVRTDITGGPSFANGIVYDGNGRIGSQTYPTGLSVDYVYTAKGFLHRVNLGQAATISPRPATSGGAPGALASMSAGAFLWMAQSYSAWGKPDQQAYGNNVISKTGQDGATGRVTSLTAGISARNYVMSYSYGWDSLNQIRTRSDAIGDGTSGAVTDMLTYDGLGRLYNYVVAAPSLPGLQRTVMLQYNALGMLLSKSDVGFYSYPAQGANAVRPHALQTVGGASGSSYDYDANGNMKSATSGAYRSITYTSFNLPNSDAQSGGLAAAPGGPRYGWQYDEDHQRIKETLITSAGTRVTWMLHPDSEGGLAFESEVAPGGTVSNRHYLTAGGQAIGVLVSNGALPTLGAAQTSPTVLTGVALVKVEYWHKDYLGSLVATTDHAGNVTQRYSYDPFGKRRVAGGAYDADGNLVYDWNDTNRGTDRGFTGHEHLDNVGLVHMNGRLYDPRLGVFLQADPLIANPFGLQDFNRYAYCNLDPMSCTDPSGYLRLFGHRVLPGLFKNKIFRIVAAVAISYFLMPGGYAWGEFGVLGGVTTNPIVQTAISGFAGGAVASGNLSGGLQGAVSAIGFYGVGELVGGMETFGSAMVHGVAGCVSSEINGGKCGPGFLSASFSKAMIPVTAPMIRVDPLAGTVISAVVGGAGALLGGGKFANGALTAAFGYLFNCGHDPGTCMSDQFSDDPRGHEYEHNLEYTTYICVFPDINCSREIVLEGVMRFPAPFSSGSRMVNTGDISYAGFAGLNPVMHVVDRANFAVFNLTQPGHWFQDASGAGYVYRNVQQDKIGVFIQTYGAGNGPLKNINNAWVIGGGWGKVNANVRNWYVKRFSLEMKPPLHR